MLEPQKAQISRIRCIVQDWLESVTVHRIGYLLRCRRWARHSRLPSAALSLFPRPAAENLRLSHQLCAMAKQCQESARSCFRLQAQTSWNLVTIAFSEKTDAQAMHWDRLCESCGRQGTSVKDKLQDSLGLAPILVLAGRKYCSGKCTVVQGEASQGALVGPP